MELGQSGKIEQNLPFLYLILSNCPLFLLNSYTNSELIHIVTSSTVAWPPKNVRLPGWQAHMHWNAYKRRKSTHP